MTWTRELIGGGLIAIVLGGFLVGFERAGASSDLLMLVTGWLAALFGCVALMTGIVLVALGSSKDDANDRDAGDDG